jgi:pyruvate dehydrogenase E2 component (dihydrolipoamide acetyltransferase)
MPEVIMPKMGDAMEAGTLSTWLKSEGDAVEIGDVLAEIETDKATMELTAEDAGILQEIIASEGDAVPVGEAIAVIVGEGEEAPPRREAKQAEDGARGDGVDEPPAATAAEVEAPEEQEGKAPEEQEGKAPEDEEGGPSPAERSADGRVRASPIVRRLAGEHNIDLSGIRGTGPAGRIVERDLRTALKTHGGPVEERPADSATAGPAPTGAPGTELKQLSRMQRVVGERMQQSWQQAPHHYATVEVHVDDLLVLRKQLNAGLEEDGIKLSINDFVMKACAVALRKFPKLNSLWTSDGIEWHATVDLAMAVALEDGLITPVIKDVANKTLSSISTAAKELASRAREGKLEPNEFQGGTFTVSNMGMYGVESFTAIVNPPSVAIVAVSSLIRRPGFDAEDNVVPQNMMKLTIGSDHRVVNGAENALYLAEVKRLLERPALLTV